MFPVSQSGLHEQSLRFADRTLKDATVFPFFDDAGAVSHLMIVAPETPRIVLVDWFPGVIERTWRGLRVPLAWDSLCDASESAAHEVSALWHHDPWWLLGEGRYRGKSVVPILKTTNTVGYDSDLKDVLYSRDLSRVVSVSKKGRLFPRIVAMTDAPLAQAARARANANTEAARSPLPNRSFPPYDTGGWKLRPIWERR